MFSSPAPFAEVFPEIEDITVEIKEEGYMVSKKATYNLTMETLRPHIPCNNISCKKNSGFDLQPIITDMVRNKKTILDTSAGCNGTETSMKRDCLNAYDVRISIKYKEIPSN